MIFVLIAIFGGAAIVFSRIFNAQLAAAVGLVEGSFYNYLTGLIGSLMLGFFTGEIWQAAQTVGLNEVPLWAYTGGLIGLIVVLMSSALTPKMSNLYLTLFIFLGQIGSGLIIDFFLEGVLSPGKLLGGLLVLSGLSYNLYLDQKS